MDGQRDFGDLTGPQRAHLMNELGAELEYQRLKVSLALLQRVEQSTSADAASGWAQAFDSIQAVQRALGPRDAIPRRPDPTPPRPQPR